MHIAELVAAGPTLSVELWPPRTPEAAQRLEDSLARLMSLRPSFASITYGASGSTRDRTHELVMKIQSQGLITPMAHLTTAEHSKTELVEILARYRDGGVTNILALRGDRPLSTETPLSAGELRYAVELVELAKSVGDFCVAVAAHPEGHPDAASRDADIANLAAKLEVADLAITQFFFRAEDYLDMVEQLRARGIDKPVIPGVMPITNMKTLSRMAELAGCVIPEAIAARVEVLGQRTEDIRKFGVDVATELCDKLMAEGVPGLHFYTMNQVRSTLEICANLGLNGAGLG